jgi:hypothetical protein
MVDKNFLEFWGNFLLSAAKGQRQLEEFSRWMSQGMSGFRDLSQSFQQVYGLGSERPEGDEGWKTSRASFEKAYKAYLDALGVVPKSDYLALQKQLEELRQQTEGQETALRKLRLELSESRMAQGDVVAGFQELIQVQSEQFQELTESFNRLFIGREKKEGSKK